jgi:hypothetical protein
MNKNSQPAISSPKSPAAAIQSPPPSSKAKWHQSPAAQQLEIFADKPPNVSSAQVDLLRLNVKLRLF